MDINGIAHVILTTGDFARAREFYGKLLPLLGMKQVLDQPGYFYCVGGRTALGIKVADPEYRGQRFVQARVGLQHLCFRARERADIDALHAWLQQQGATIVHGPQEDRWAPGYYSVLFEDPDGIRLEMNHVPGKGLLEVDRKFGAP
ncbi:MAG TPA: VOC family protein [Nevskiaceae bacterium]|nr:VOC family protein [Nevskiaceae bacterium]